MIRKLLRLLLVFALIAGLSSGCSAFLLTSPVSDAGSAEGGKPYARAENTPQRDVSEPERAPASFRYEDVPEYVGEPFVMMNGGAPYFDLPDGAGEVKSFETYSELDELGRCGPAYAAVGTDLMPTAERESISSVKPSGWNQAMYDNVDGNALFNRCHLLGYQLTAENANPLNLITGTRYLNTQGMLPFENMVADYVHETGNHVLYRVTPVFVGEELVARGVLMEAASMEDGGEGVLYCVFAYNVQPGIGVDYADGASWPETSAAGETGSYVLNTGTKKFHRTDCASVGQMSPSRRQAYEGARADLMAQGYAPCGSCRP